MIRQYFEKALFETNMRLSEKCITSFELYVAELKKWNNKVNLTAICKDSDIVVKHLIDALFFISCVNTDDNVLDIGSGPGIPAIPLKIVKPDVRVVSVDAVNKKIMFQKHISRLLEFYAFEALHARVESLHSTHAGSFDVITSRAFSRLDLFVSLAAPLLKSGGRLIAMKGPEVLSEINGAGSILSSLGLEVSSITNYSLPMDKGNRSLVTISAAKARK
jgi:16S rRNA (guanine527-N7)-methyltransferase